VSEQERELSLAARLEQITESTRWAKVGKLVQLAGKEAEKARQDRVVHSMVTAAVLRQLADQIAGGHITPFGMLERIETDRARETDAEDEHLMGGHLPGDRTQAATCVTLSQNAVPAALQGLSVADGEATSFSVFKGSNGDRQKGSLASHVMRRQAVGQRGNFGEAFAV